MYHLGGFISPFATVGGISLAVSIAITFALPKTDNEKECAIGDVGRDHLLNMQRCGIDSFDLREGEDDFLSSWKLKSIIRKYSDHISLPILMKKEEWDAEKKENVVKDEFETINQASALWARSKSDITPEQYNEFYKHVSHDFEAPLTYTHNRVEGRSEYTQLLYIPTRAPFDLWDRNKRGGIKLYVKRVFIMDDAEQLMPVYLRFVKGVIDSSDLPLNVSRELLQESRDVKAMREGSTKRVLSMLEELANSDDQAQQDKYATFWKEFGQVLKEGIGEDARLVFITHRALESDVQACVSEFRKSPVVKRASGLIRVIGE